jgi:hypothetical protein
MFVPFMMGHQFGPPFHSAVQKRILQEMLNLLTTVNESPTIYDMPITWAEVRTEARAIERQLGLTT